MPPEQIPESWRWLAHAGELLDEDLAGGKPPRPRAADGGQVECARGAGRCGEYVSGEVLGVLAERVAGAPGACLPQAGLLGCRQCCGPECCGAVEVVAVDDDVAKPAAKGVHDGCATCGVGSRVALTIHSR